MGSNPPKHYDVPGIEDDYTYYKGFHSIVLLAFVDADYKVCTWILELVVTAVTEECLER